MRDLSFLSLLFSPFFSSLFSASLRLCGYLILCVVFGKGGLTAEAQRRREKKREKRGEKYAPHSHRSGLGPIGPLLAPMTNLYAWNTARAGSMAHPNVAGSAYSTLQGLHRGSITLHPGAMKPHRDSITLHPGGVKLHRGSITLHPGTIKLYRGSMKLNPGAMKLHLAGTEFNYDKTKLLRGSDSSILVVYGFGDGAIAFGGCSMRLYRIAAYACFSPLLSSLFSAS
ncbi:MAG: hypothetical protein BECKG1743D_GA0114223_101523 [Candidatus Kentron sp. G]|nr:MAG: hypothetical protein BECKG1743F_GA0114225_100278 [Candidatus Kentron sp. G]VFM97575.1 MAG: hypothetical protein BECKG1743E_GA0114224_101392 [Candidatus Kentron sp. G]VFM99863.1 MAG: hypothetical protein BECKG1743D_GA0114223_101523 [Candidatus Kentron sp. G]